MTKKRHHRGDSNHGNPGTLPHALTTALSAHNLVTPKRSNTEKLFQEQLNDEKTIKKRQFLLKKKRQKKSKNDDFIWKQRCKKRQKNDKETIISYT